MALLLLRILRGIYGTGRKLFYFPSGKGSFFNSPHLGVLELKLAQMTPDMTVSPNGFCAQYLMLFALVYSLVPLVALSFLVCAIISSVFQFCPNLS